MQGLVQAQFQTFMPDNVWDGLSKSVLRKIVHLAHRHPLCPKKAAVNLVPKCAPCTRTGLTGPGLKPTHLRFLRIYGFLGAAGERGVGRRYRVGLWGCLGVSGSCSEGL